MASQLNAIDAGHACFRQMYIRPQWSPVACVSWTGIQHSRSKATNKPEALVHHPLTPRNQSRSKKKIHRPTQTQPSSNIPDNTDRSLLTKARREKSLLHR
ncbi:hypothetical protein HBI04_056610 [Parastagonospora nodorum]|nr:hypothetical protein HBH50_143140 [Parastagonospora nodorum]KAH4086141.1 hypothetical protein HBH48_146850 [Parastagonospora nodorum]KAH4189234.1 hypothetical protein HBH42_141060 [Parastagonospora nodorum]KAH4280142.1 hypothetical protein HBI04_056610 [Parastagonospora nodorum]KAH4296970.1 hypothetical protein HBI01_142600 [Parastagonospora nodorum]